MLLTAWAQGRAYHVCQPRDHEVEEPVKIFRVHTTLILNCYIFKMLILTTIVPIPSARAPSSCFNHMANSTYILRPQSNVIFSEKGS